jgi:hypothetical protein
MSQPDPRQHDEQTVALYFELTKATRQLQIEVEKVHFEARDKRDYRQRNHPWGLSDGEALAKSTPLARAEYEKASGEIRSLLREIDGMDVIYQQHRWTRYYFCTNTNGHIHSDERACSTLRPTTQMAWHPELSGLTGAEVVEQAGPAMCSVCYPDAPAEHTSSDLTAIERERTRGEREAAKAERDESKARKRLTAAEQFRTSYDRDLVETVAACKDLIRRAIEQQIGLEYYSRPSAAEEWQGNRESFTRIRRNIASSLEQMTEDAGRAAAILMEREQQHEGYGASAEEIARIRTSKERSARKQWGL